MEDTLFGLLALMALIPVSLVSLRKDGVQGGLFWLLLAVAVAGPLIWTVAQMPKGWQAGLSTTLWVIVAATMTLFAATAAMTRHARRLTPLVGPYMVALCLLAIIWRHAPARTLEIGAMGGWIATHIVFSVITYSLATLAAIAALAAFLRQRSLKSKQPIRLTHLLPSMADCNHLLVRLLILGEVVLGLGLATGMAIQYKNTGQFLIPNHKTILTVASFAVIAGLLYTHFRSGIRGRKAVRLLLLAYLLLTLGYPGVKFVADIIVVS